MSTLQERYASGEFDVDFKQAGISAAELQTKENHRLAKAAWLELPFTKEMLKAVENIHLQHTLAAMQFSDGGATSENVRLQVAKASAVLSVIEKLKQQN